MRKLTVKVINSTQANRIGVNETLAVVKRQSEERGVGPTKEPKRKPWSSQPPQWFVEFATEMKTAVQTIIKRLDRLESRLDRLESRLDNIVKLNHLKE